MVDHAVVFDRFTAPMQNLLQGFLQTGKELRRLFSGSPGGGREAVEESALSAEAARPDESA